MLNFKNINFFFLKEKPPKKLTTIYLVVICNITRREYTSKKKICNIFFNQKIMSDPKLSEYLPG